MALRRWRWVWVPMLAAVVAAIALLPPRTPSSGDLLVMLGLFEPFGAYDRTAPFRNDVRQAAATQRRRLDQELLVDSLLGAARGSGGLRSADGRVTVVYERPLTHDSATVWLRAATAELALYPEADAPGLPVLVAILSDPRRADRPQRPLRWPLARWLLGASPAPGVCVVVVDLVSRVGLRPPLLARNAAGRPLGRFLDDCALYARYGLPGPMVEAWWKRTGWYEYSADALTSRILEARRVVQREQVWFPTAETAPFWVRGFSWREDGCLHGEARLCARAASLDTVRADRYQNVGDFTRRQVLAYLLVHGTPAQFAAFWRSPLPPGAALRAAFGEPAGRLAQRAFAHWYAPASSSGPRVAARILVAGISWAGIALVLAVVAGRRRETGL
jgi:hypothetical protein